MSAGPDYTGSFVDVAAAEREWIAERRAAVGGIPAEAPLVGLGLSGGGIRSAAFNMGVLQALANAGLLPRVDYLSTVSGGGYIGSCLSWLRAHVPVKSSTRLGDLPLADGKGTVLDWLRAHGRYLIAGKGLSSWTLAASVLSGTLLNLFVLLPFFILLIGLMSADWFEFNWSPELHLPGAGAVNAHDGFMVVALAGLALLLLYLLATFVFALSTVLPPLRRITVGQILRQRLGVYLGSGISLLAIGILPIMVGIEQTVGAMIRMNGIETLTRHGTWIAPLVTGALSFWRASKKGPNSGALATLGLVLVLVGLFTALYHLANHTGLLQTPGFKAWIGASLVFAMICDINAVSMHSYYRSRLAEAFMPNVADPSGKVVPPRDPLEFRLTDMQPSSGGPFQIVNTTLNTSSSKDEHLRARFGENLFLTPLYCGSTATGFRRTANYMRGELTLSTAFSVSGAAVDPDTYATHSRPVSVLMSLLNIRLGVWVPNPKHEPHKFRWPAWYQLMLREMLGLGLSETQARVHLADGGHFENLGLYELLRRQCRYIILGDAGADPGATLADLGQAVQRARADLGADVDLCADALVHGGDSLRDRVHLFGGVTYADGSKGEILYLKALMRTKLGADVYGYWRTNPDFPDQPTSNQFYGELQFDSYRELGRELMATIIGDERGDVAKVFARWRDA